MLAFDGGCKSRCLILSVCRGTSFIRLLVAVEAKNFFILHSLMALRESGMLDTRFVVEEITYDEEQNAIELTLQETNAADLRL